MHEKKTIKFIQGSIRFDGYLRPITFNGGITA